ncbi:MAG: type IX secretion system sortase PorU [Lewinellaceae bacterium]|nr:type IX secretion system sortase PorU [Lewinellaceae bacterium]
MKNQLLSILLLFAAAATLSAQNSRTIQHTLQWQAQPVQHVLTGGDVLEFWHFDGGTFSDASPGLPVFAEQFVLPGRARLEVEVVSVQYEPFPRRPAIDVANVPEDLKVNASVAQARNTYYGEVSFIALRKQGSTLERVKSFTLNVRIIAEPAPVKERGGPYTYNSALGTGEAFKFGVAKSGIYKLDYNFLKNDLGISNLDNIDPRTIRLYGNGGAMLPEKNSDTRPDDLIENAIRVVGEADGKFDAGDYILFYAVGTDPWLYRPSTNDPELTVRKNIYDAYAWYFIKTGDGNGLRVTEQASVPAGYVTESFDDVRRLEEERTNLLDFFVSAQGSGKKWFGDYFYQTRKREYSFDFPNLVPGSTARFRMEFAGRCGCGTGGSNLRLIADGTSFTGNVNSVSVSNNEANYAALGLIRNNFQTTGTDVINISLEYLPTSQQSEGWLDYIEVNARRRLVMTGQSMEFRDLETVAQNAATFRLSGVSGTNLIVWDITDPQKPFLQQKTQNGGTVEFGATTQGVLRNFIAYYDNATFPKPETTAGKIASQNLHGIDNVHMAIVYHPDFEAQATRLAEHRRSFSGLDVVLVNIDQLYNEFSSGGKDPSAIRDFAGMLLDRNPDKFEWLLLFGDGSFDPRNNTASPDNKDFVPVFETAESFDPIRSYPSDDYFGLLSPEDGGTLGGKLDIAAGRLTVRSAAEATAIVDKIIAYDKDPATLGDWHLRNVFIADDEDGNPHINQADDLANMTANTEDWFNIEKIYFDAYQQVATSGGQRYPDAKAAINSNIFKGNLVTQYIGHGGPRGWAQERVIDNNDIAGWDNPDRYPLIITATCSFGGYDDYKTLTGGEQSLIKVKSGAIALFTTVRAVFISGNEKLTDAVQNYLFRRVDGQYRSIGDILKDAKNSLTSEVENARRFTLLGDPAMFLAMPEYRVATTRINGKDVAAGQPDTLRALMPVTLEGVVTDTLNNVLNDFNGRVVVSVYDKAQTIQTLGQDPGSLVRTFSVQRNVIFKGSATVSAGKFTIDFIVPKDINYTYGAGKISYYAENGTPLDAAGADENIVIGGNANLVQDDQPPLVQAFLNTDAFVTGGITDPDPKILVKCSDDYGMNVSGVSLGHDLTAVLDGNVLETIVLNDFYESEQDNFRKGQAIYPLRNLAPGRHTLSVKGWDIANNSGEGYTEFVVAEDGKAALDHVLNYPNPFTTNTSFQFEHNLAGQALDVQISIFTVSGRLVKTLFHSAPAEGYRVTDISWDGRDEYGDQLARGVYLYRVKVRGTDLNGAQADAESDFEKLVILK